MKLSSALPKHSELNRSQFVDKGKVNRLSLAIDHVVSGPVAGRERVGEAKIVYNLDFVKKGALDSGFTIQAVPAVGVQSTDLISRIIEEMRPRTSYSVAKVSSTMFDLRALCFVLGSATAAGIGNATFDVHPTPAGLRTLGTGWNVPGLGEVIFGPEVARTPQELATLTSLAACAGISTVTVLRDDIPSLDGNHYVGRNLAVFSYRVVASILQSAHDAMCYCSHREAFELGKNVHMRLSGHTDEAGWLRTVMRSLSFPPPCGYVCPTGTNFLELPLQESIAREDIMRKTIGDYLEYVALFAVADIRVHGEAAIIRRTDGDGSRSSHYDLLQPSLFDVFNAVRKLIAERDGTHEDVNQGNGMLTDYMQQDPQDRHFQGLEYLIPFFFVEPGPLLTKDYEGFKAPAVRFRTTTMPLFGAQSVVNYGGMVDSSGRAAPQSRSYIKLKGGCARDFGYSYLLSSRYHIDDGLGQLKYVSSDGNSLSGELPMFTDDVSQTLAVNRWVTPHNPCPAPFEGFAPGGALLEYRHVSKREDVRISEFLNAKVESTLGAFHVIDDDHDGAYVSHRTVPSWMRRKLVLVAGSEVPMSSFEPTTFGQQPDASPPPVGDEVAPDPSVPAAAPTSIDTLPSPDPSGPQVTSKVAPTGVKPSAPVVKNPKRNPDEQSGNGH